MKNESAFFSAWRSAVVGWCIASISFPQSAVACAGSAGQVCVINPAACVKSMVLTKAVPTVVVFPPGGPATFAVPMNLFITCPATNNCGTGCPAVGIPVAGSLTVTLFPSSAPPGVPPPPCAPFPVVATTTLTTAGGTMAMPMCSGAGTFNPYVVGVTAPAGTLPGFYCVVGTATVTFSDGTVLTQTGDTVVCLVEPAPGNPAVPRLGLQLLSPPFPRLAPGDQAVVQVRVTNNDPTESVQLSAYGSSRQGAVRPQGANEQQGVFAISNPFGDDFPIQFDPSPSCIPLPEHPYTQPMIHKVLPTLAPGQSTIVFMGVRSYGQCASGSCSETTVGVQGLFSDGARALGCVGMSLSVDTSIPSLLCGLMVNDCNRNGIPDALDISARRSVDQNFNAMPDECEEVINVPVFSSVNPPVTPPRGPLQVQFALNEVIPVQSAWANGVSLTRTQFFGTPLWVGTIPADSRPGPQTVYFLGKDSIGGLSTYIATYNVGPPPPPPVITDIRVAPSGGVTIEHNQAITGRPVFVEETTDLNCPSCWRLRPNGPHPSPVTVGLATGKARFFRLAEYAALRPDQGVSFSQVDFTWPASPTPDSTTGRIEVDIPLLRQATGIDEGYVNVVTSQGWVVQNLPVYRDFTYPRMATTFRIGTVNGVDVPVMNGHVLYSPTPLTQPPLGPTMPHAVGTTAVNTQGKDLPVTPGFTPTPQPPAVASFQLGGVIQEWSQAGHPNIESADDQCGPAAKANSLQWLENTYGINIPHPHQAGLDGDGSLVGELDRTMGRTSRDRRDGDPVTDAQYLEGVLEYLANNGLGAKICVKHQDDGTGGGPGGGNVTMHGVTSTGNGLPTAAWIIAEIAAGEDVEVGYTRADGSGHWVNAVKGGYLMGVPYIFHVSDGDQTNDKMGTGAVDFGFLVDTDGDGLPNLVGEPGNPNVDVVVSESPKP